MPHSAIVAFTARPLEWILHDQGSRDWRLDPERAAGCDYLVCTQNRHNARFGAPTAPHGAAFLIGRQLEVVRSLEEPDRWLIKFREYSIPDKPILNIWGKSGHHRYPIHYTTLEALGIDPASLPPFKPVGPPPDLPGFADAGLYPPLAPSVTRRSPEIGPPARRDGDVAARLDAILSQLDRIPDQPGTFDALPWDERGLPG